MTDELIWEVVKEGRFVQVCGCPPKDRQQEWHEGASKLQRALNGSAMYQSDEDFIRSLEERRERNDLIKNTKDLFGRRKDA